MGISESNNGWNLISTDSTVDNNSYSYNDFTIQWDTTNGSYDISTRPEALTIKEDTLVRVGNKYIRWGEIEIVLEWLMEHFEEEIQAFKIADRLSRGKDEQKD